MTTYKTTRKTRYKGFKGKFWDVLSDYIRLRDFIKYGTCITCGKKFNSWNESQAGHFIAAGNCGFSLLFDEKNINGECGRCNAFDSNHQIPMRANIVKRYGEDFVLELEERFNEAHYKGKVAKEWGKKEYEAKTAEMLNKVLDLHAQL